MLIGFWRSLKTSDTQQRSRHLLQRLIKGQFPIASIVSVSIFPMSLVLSRYTGANKLIAATNIAEYLEQVVDEKWPIQDFTFFNNSQKFWGFWEIYSKIMLCHVITLFECMFGYVNFSRIEFSSYILTAHNIRYLSVWEPICSRQISCWTSSNSLKLCSHVQRIV